ncbi:MAG: ATP-binding protein [Leptothrix sp. (in: b-proteobacteria)]
MATHTTTVFHRPELARRLAEQVLYAPPSSASSSGLFLAAPRRTGKSTFMREDLRPALEAAGALVVYADLWENRKADPGAVIVAALRSALAPHEGVVTRLARSAGLDGVKVGGLSFSLDRVGLGREVSLVQALVALSDEIGRPIVLIIDEAQHAISTEAGSDALFALKAARDELNSSRHHGLRVVATGSNQDKLAMLRASKEQAFFGAPLVKFPPLGRDYIEWFCSHLQLATPLAPDAVFELFQQASHRPEILGAAADMLRFDFELQAADVRQRFAAEVQVQIDAANQDLLQVVHSLTPLQSAVLRVLAACGAGYAPFEAATLAMYRAALQAAGADPEVRADVPGVQQALSALQDKSLVWKAARGVYALEDTTLADLLTRQGLLEGLADGSAAPGSR